MDGEIPGFEAALAEETRLREVAFFPINEEICGIEVLPMTALHFSILSFARSPFLNGGIPTSADIPQFLWVVSPHYDPTDTYARDALIAKVGPMDAEALVKAIDSYVADALMDVPGGRSGGSNGQPIACFDASMVHRIASKYGWSEYEILHTPLKRLFQYLRLIIHEEEPDRPVINTRSDSVAAAWAAKQTEALQNG